MTREIGPLPVLVRPAEGESGWGFLLRSAHANRFTLQSLVSVATDEPRSPLADSHIVELAYTTGVAPTWLASRLPRPVRVDRYRHLEWMGASWACPLALRTARLQYCPLCIQEGGHCMAAWEMTAAFACLKHRRLLDDCCSHCGAHAAWHRPAVEVCACGRSVRTSSVS